MSTTTASLKAKRAEIADLISCLQHHSSTTDRAAAAPPPSSASGTAESHNTNSLASVLVRLKVLGREPAGAEQIFTQLSIDRLAALAFYRPVGDAATLEAARCLANALLLAEPARGLFVRGGWTEEAAARYADGTADDEFLCARLLFLCAYGADPGYEKLVEKHALATSITTVWTLRRLSSPRTALHSTSPLTTAVPQKLTAHAASPSPSQSPADPTTTATQTAHPALTETLKLLFTLLHHAPTLTPLFSGAATAAVLRLLLAAPHTHGAVTRATHDPSAPLPHLVSALLSLPLDAATAFDEPQPPPPPLLHEGSGAEESREAQDAMGETHLVACLVSLLDASLAPATPANTPMPMSAPGPTTSLTAPLLALLRRVHALTAPIPPAVTLTVAQQTARTYLSASLLPRPVDRLLPLGTGPSLPHRLLRLLSPASLVPPASSPAAATANSSISRSSADAPAAASLLLELSSHDADALVRHIGFGLASGVLADAGLSATAPSPSSSSSSTTIEGQPIDFVTGQFIEARDAAAAGTRRPDGDGAGTREMSDAEKLREAERLYVLFERLRATGVVRAENPVHAAARAGGLVTELAEGDEDEDDD